MNTERCWNCSGSGAVHDGSGGQMRCITCGGRGWAYSANNPFQPDSKNVIQLLFEVAIHLSIAIISSKLFQFLAAKILRILYYISLVPVVHWILNKIFVSWKVSAFITLIIYSVLTYDAYFHISGLSNKYKTNWLDALNYSISEIIPVSGTLSIFSDSPSVLDVRFAIKKNLPPQYKLVDIHSISANPDYSDSSINSFKIEAAVPIQTLQPVYKKVVTYDVSELKKYISNIDRLNMPHDKVSVYQRVPEGVVDNIVIHTHIRKGSVFWQIAPTELSNGLERVGVLMDSPITEGSKLAKQLAFAQKKVDRVRFKAYSGLWKGGYTCDNQSESMWIRMKVDSNGDIQAIEKSKNSPRVSSFGRFSSDGSFHIREKQFKFRYNNKVFITPDITGHVDAGNKKITAHFDGYCSRSLISLTKD